MIRPQMHPSKSFLQIIFKICRPKTNLSATYGLRPMAKYSSHHHTGEKRQRRTKASINDGSDNEVLYTDIKHLLSKSRKSESTDNEVPEKVVGYTEHQQSQPAKFSEIEVEVSELSSTGDGLGIAKSQDHVYVVPFSVPGDIVLAKTVNQFPMYTLTDFIKIIKPGPSRDDSLSRCPYFAKCAGCQIQMLPYDAQLAHKKSIVEKAYRNFSTLTREVVPTIGETIGSPLQYGYRTKLTPHFDGPPGAMSRSWRKDPSKRKGLTEVPAIGFQEKGRGKTIDIEDCPIGTEIVREGMRTERSRIARDFGSYIKGATILLRESTVRRPLPSGAADSEVLESTVSSISEIKQGKEPTAQDTSNNASDRTPDSFLETKSCITDQRAESTEYVDSYIFKNTAGAFFQNNNSILPIFTAYIRDHIIPSEPAQPPIKYLIDAYCGSGLFTITLSSLFASSLGIDISGASVSAAHENAKLNNIRNARFITADAAQLFKEVDFPAAETAVVIDPPRKGCDDAFLKQLLRFGPKRVVYVR